MKTTKLLCVICAMGLCLQTNAAGLGDKVANDKNSGMLSFGMRNTYSLFSESNSIGKGVGGHFRIQFSDRVNSQWFADYLVTNIDGRALRTDYHVGWSVMYYPVKSLSNSERLIQPYVMGGHCFDQTVVEDLGSTNKKSRFSSAAQLGIGNHFNLTDRFDLSVETQYMVHLGADLHTHVLDEAVEIEKTEGFSLEGHLLITLSLNYKIAKLWKGSH